MTRAQDNDIIVSFTFSLTSPTLPAPHTSPSHPSNKNQSRRHVVSFHFLLTTLLFDVVGASIVCFVTYIISQQEILKEEQCRQRERERENICSSSSSSIVCYNIIIIQTLMSILSALSSIVYYIIGVPILAYILTRLFTKLSSSSSSSSIRPLESSSKVKVEEEEEERRQTSSSVSLSPPLDSESESSIQHLKDNIQHLRQQLLDQNGRPVGPHNEGGQEPHGHVWLDAAGQARRGR
ncbi:hypothetical protein DFA_01763 [Cavenderia fasciculata]|uniref:Transmembrane protein n=1 Tax=Cavenderia fasciculata TaxID=261658 RepID=F4PUL3_CACFS|nr:uncharacterized protein DFA_01763 [Cavenderia fasciculata]EGG21877.1 hypothetical protein DFA_01763 [Cavenderia fasciculata]|eukprot:XP_004359728.1 hypothetical protein DFA_01763 [Cavenderia fasciculata]